MSRRVGKAAAVGGSVPTVDPRTQQEDGGHGVNCDRMRGEVTAAPLPTLRLSANRTHYFARRVTLSQLLVLAPSGKSGGSFRASRLEMRGVSRSSRDARRGAVGVVDCSAGLLAPTNDPLRTVKSRGPDIPMLISTHVEALASRGDGGQKARRTRENAKQPFNHRAGRAGFPADLWYLPPAFFSQAGHGPQSRSGSPCALCLKRAVRSAKLGQIVSRDRAVTSASVPYLPLVGTAAMNVKRRCHSR